jgi:hypothetical protein
LPYRKDPPDLLRAVVRPLEAGDALIVVAGEFANATSARSARE